MERALADPGLTPGELLDRLLAALDQVADLTGACAHLTDPLSGVPIAGATHGDPPGSFERSMEFEFRRPDAIPYAQLAQSRRKVGTLSGALGSRLRDSARFLEMIEPGGSADELRIACVDAYGMWATVGLFGRRRFDVHDVELAARLVRPIADAVRRARAGDIRHPRGGDATAVAVLDANDRLQAADELARTRIERLTERRRGPLPTAFYVLADQARVRDPDVYAAAHAWTDDGQCLLLEASALGDERYAPVAIVMRPPDPGMLLETALRANGLTARERQIAARAARGLTAKIIADELHLSRYTVEDHLKHVYAKTHATSRADLARLAAIDD